MISPAPVATRVDPEGGFTEEAAVRSFAGSSIFEVTYLPRVPARAGVVICPSILVEQLTNYRCEVLLARALAARGLAVQRFHYRGTGHSGGGDDEVTMEGMVEDTAAAAARLRERSEAPQTVFMGTRWGSIVAAAAATPFPSSPLVLWEPVISGERYFNQLVRGRLVREMKDARFAAGTDAWKEEMASQGRIDVLGYALYRSVYESGRRTQILSMVGDRTGPALVVQFGRQASPRPDNAQLVERLASRGARVDIRFIPDEPAWFFPGYLIASAGDLITLTARWVWEITGGSGA